MAPALALLTVADSGAEFLALTTTPAAAAAASVR
jgi:hypothetical protein